MFRVISKTRRGGSRIAAFHDEDDLVFYLKSLRCDSRVEKDGEIIGGVWKNEGRWVWNFESERENNERK